MEPRIRLTENPITKQFLDQVIPAGKVVTGSPLPAVLRHLVALRVSQINGCAVSADIHTKQAEAAGETPTRLHLLAAWRHATVFTDAERAALELAEQATRVADAGGGVDDDVWAAAAAHYDEVSLAALLCLVSYLNLINRLNIAARTPGDGGFRPPS